MTLALSFEVFPPKSADGLGELQSTVCRLAEVRPSFVSVTYGAGGSDRHRSFAAIDALRVAGIDVAGHLTCAGQSRAEIDDVIDEYGALGVGRIVALRGDAPGGAGAPYSPHVDGHHRTADLVHAIKQRGSFEVSVAAYPERHPESPSDDHDIDVLADKVSAGADMAITQMFFDNTHYLRLRDRVSARGLDVPIVPGIFPIHCIDTVSRFAAKCGASIPASVRSNFTDLDAAEPSTRHRVAADVAATQMADLVDHGVERFHLYTLNRADLALQVCEQLGIASVPAR